MIKKIYRNFSPYDLTINVYLGKNNLEYLNNKFNIQLENDFDGIAEQITNYEYLICFNTEKIEIPLLVHELLHLMDWIIDTFEKKICKEGNSEIRARMIELLTKNILKDFKDHILL